MEKFKESVWQRNQRQPTYVYNCNMFTDIIPNHIYKVHCNTDKSSKLKNLFDLDTGVGQRIERTKNVKKPDNQFYFWRSVTVTLVFSTSIKPPWYACVGLLENKLNHSSSVLGFKSGWSGSMLILQRLNIRSLSKIQ